MNFLDNTNQEWLNLNSGTKFHIKTYSDNDITIEDIAKGLSFCSRYARQTNKFYSVAEHSLLVEQYIDEFYKPKIVHAIPADYDLWKELSKRSAKLRLYALLHDAGEYIFGDVPNPLDFLYEKVCEQEAYLTYRILRKYELDDKFIIDYKTEIKSADYQVYCREVPEVYDNIHTDFKYYSPDSIAQSLKINFYLPNKVLIKRFISRFNKIRKDIKKCQKF